MLKRMLRKEWEQHTGYSHKLAYILSRMFDTSVTVFLVAMTFVLKAEFLWGWIIVMAMGNFIIPILFLLNSFRTQRITDLDITSRQERVVWFSIAAGFWVLTLVAVFVIDPLGIVVVPDVMKLFQIWLAIFGVFNAVITYFWKISGHVMVATAWSLWLAFLWNPWFILLLVTLVPIISWGRWRLNKHTPAQLVGGILLMLLITPLVWWLFGPLFYAV